MSGYTNIPSVRLERDSLVEGRGTIARHRQGWGEGRLFVSIWLPFYIYWWYTQICRLSHIFGKKKKKCNWPNHWSLLSIFIALSAKFFLPDSIHGVYRAAYLCTVRLSHMDSRRFTPSESAAPSTKRGIQEVTRQDIRSLEPPWKKTVPKACKRKT